MVKGGWRRQNRDEGEFQFIYSNTDLENIIKTVSLRNFINAQHLRYIGHVCHMANTTLTKKLLFATPTKRYYRDPWIKITEIFGVHGPSKEVSAVETRVFQVGLATNKLASVALKKPIEEFSCTGR